VPTALGVVPRSELVADLDVGQADDGGDVAGLGRRSLRGRAVGERADAGDAAFARHHGAVAVAVVVADLVACGQGAGVEASVRSRLSRRAALDLEDAGVQGRG